MKRLALLMMTTLAIAGLGGAARAADQAPEAAKLSFGNPKPSLQIFKDGSKFSGKVEAVIVNSGGKEANVTFALILDYGLGWVAYPSIEAVEVTGGSFEGTVPPTGAVSVIVMFDLQTAEAIRSGQIELVDEGGGSSPVVADLLLQRWVGAGVYLFLMAVAAGLGLLIALVGKRRAKAGLGDSADSNPTVYTEKAWSFGDSWATNITALGGLLGTALGASGFVAEVLPGLPTGRFTGLSLLFGGLAVAGPLIYIALSRRVPVEKKPTQFVTYGTLRGLWISAAFTTGAAVGELLTIAALVNLSPATRVEEVLAYGAVAAAVFAIALYQVRTMTWLVSQRTAPPSAEEGQSPASGGVMVAAAGVG